MRRVSASVIIATVTKGLEARGLAHGDAQAHAHHILASLIHIAAGATLPSPRDLDQIETDAKIWKLSEEMTVVQLSKRFQRSERSIYNAINRHLQRQHRIGIEDPELGNVS